MNLFNSHNIIMGLFLHPFHGHGKWGTNRTNSLPMDPQLISSRAELKPEPCNTRAGPSASILFGLLLATSSRVEGGLEWLQLVSRATAHLLHWLSSRHVVGM